MVKVSFWRRYVFAGLEWQVSHTFFGRRLSRPPNLLGLTCILKYQFVSVVGLLNCTLCLCSLIHWVLGDYAQLDFMAQWFKQLCYLVVTHFFWTRAHRALRTLNLMSLCLYPSLIIGFIYCTVVVIVGLLTVKEYKDACLGKNCSVSTTTTTNCRHGGTRIFCRLLNHMCVIE